MTLDRPARETLLAATVGLLASFFILERWLFTELGVQSFGRVWAFYINYGDFGFVRRGLVGTLLQATPLPGLVANPYHFALFVQHVALTAMAGLVAIHLLRSGRDPGLPLKLAVFLSPAFILQAAYTTGSLDIFVMIAFFANALLVRNRLLFALILFLGPFIHELFVFLAPAQLTIFYIRNDCDIVRAPRHALSRLATPVLALVVSVGIVAFLGACHMPRAAYELQMARLIPEAVGKMDLWSGYFEVGSSTEQGYRPPSFLLSNLASHAMFIALPLAYVGVLLLTVLRLPEPSIHKLMVGMSVLMPLLVYFIATDFYRWVGMCANVALVFLLFYADRQDLRMSRWRLAVILAFSLAAPFGGPVIDNPLPMHKFVHKRLFS